ncbi:gamma carbonic anhydrase family protein [Phytohabitans kaempferiae]|uniref:Gamma carbonic anhydrase family protein n=1 Tax=Phytohabitans kaempferiae TaxID=1620943 RepID=A0ABV6M1V2_9ACTN
MTIYALGEHRPRIDPSAYIHPDAVVIGQVVIGPDSSVWPGAVLRGDSNGIVVGAATNIQDGAVVHANHRHATRIGDRCVIGHLAHLEGCTIEDGTLIGSQATVLPGAVVGGGALVGACALVPGSLTVPPRTTALGVPATVRDKAPDADHLRINAEQYVLMARRYRTELKRLA